MPQDSKKTPSSLLEMSTELRLLLAFALMGVVLFVSQYFMAPPPQPKKAQTPAAQKQEPQKSATTAAPAQQTPSPAAKPAASAVKAEVVSAVKDETRIIETDVYRIVLSNRGGVAKSWVLKNYKDNNGKSVELISAAAAPVAGWPFSFVIGEGKLQTNLNDVLFQTEQKDPLGIDFTYSDGSVVAKKSFRFDPQQYKFVWSSEVTLNGEGVTHLLAWRGGFGDSTVHNAPAIQQSVHFDAPNNKLVVESSDVAKNGIHAVSGSMLFAGLQDAYFAGVVLPETGSSIDFQTWQDKFKPNKEATEDVPHVGMAVGGGARNQFLMFIGPKDQEILQATHPRLPQLVDWGWFGFIAKPLFTFLRFLDDTTTHNWGWAIVLATVLINIAMLPLRFTSLRSSQRMAALQPQVQLINKKYEGLSMRDPKKQKQNEELMALYTKSGVNPLGGCIPLLLQMPFFFAFYKVLSTAIELRGAPWLWVPDLSQPEVHWFKILPLVMLVSQFLMTKMTPTPTADNSQARMMQLMPVVLTAMFYNSPSGLVLYWLTGNLVGIVQQYFFNKFAPQAPVPAVAAATSKKK